jgi:superfamily II DNA or RNA helicase
MEPGTSVRLIADPGRVGIITGKKRERSGKTFWQVRFPDFVDYYRTVHLEVISETDEDPIDLLLEGKLGRARDLRGSLTHIRLSGRLANLIYSMGTTNTDFYSYQFKPVLNFLDAPGNGLLIADEVGLGKTIEAGLIWTELRSRYDIRRVLVLVPAVLRDKWQIELRRRFGINADILYTEQMQQYFEESKFGQRFEFTAICSMQGLRPRKGWDKNEDLKDSASKLARFLEEMQYEEPMLDLLIIDEAHYLRNPESMTSNLGRLLRNVSDHILLLSATPIHLKNRDLYQLLNLVDEDSFNQPSVHDEGVASK